MLLSFLLFLFHALHAYPAFCEVTDLPEYSAFEGLLVLRIETSGNDHTKNNVLLREIETAAGKPFHAAALIADRVRLTRISAFSSVDLVPRGEGDGVVVEIRVKETAWIIPTVTPSRSEENGWSAGPGISTPNLAGRAISASISTQFGGVTKCGVSLRNPWLGFSPRQLTVSGGFAYQERDDKIRDSREITAVSQVHAGFYPGRNRQLSLNLGFQYMRTMSDKAGVALSADKHDHLPRADFMVRLSTIEDPLAPHNGWVAGIQEMLTGGPLGGDGDSWRTQFDVVRYQPVFTRGSLALGGIFCHQSGEVGQDIPSYLQYTLGGASSIRGYSQTDLGKVLFGKDQLLATIEYDHCLVSPRSIRLLGSSFLSFRVGIEVVGFVDYGVAWTDSEDLAWDRSRTGYGSGLHILVPEIDRIRLDVGVGQGGDVKFHISIRSKYDAQRLASR